MSKMKYDLLLITERPKDHIGNFNVSFDEYPLTDPIILEAFDT